jgi:hypothetical protein
MESKRHNSKPKQVTVTKMFAQLGSAASAQEHHRRRVLETLLQRGIPISALDGDLKELLEEKREHRLSLGHPTDLVRTHLAVLEKELFKVDLAAVEAGNGVASLLFDGYSADGNFAIVIMRTVSATFEICERCVYLHIFKDHLDNVDWARVLQGIITNLGFRLAFTVADGHPANGLAGQALSGFHRHYFHSFCLSHTLAKVGANFLMPLVDSFVLAWNMVFKNSSAAQNVLKTLTGERFQRKHKVRWWTAHEQLEQVSRCWPHLPILVRELKSQNICPEAVAKLDIIVHRNSHDTVNGRQMMIGSDVEVELWAALNGGDLFKRATFFLEGSGFLAPFVTMWIKQLTTFVDNVTAAYSPPAQDMPGVATLFQRLPPQVNSNSKWAAVKGVLHPGFTYFREHFVLFSKDSLARKFDLALQLFNFCRLFHPVYLLRAIQRAHFNIVAEVAVPIVKDLLLGIGPNICSDLVNDFPAYITVARAAANPNQKITPHELEKWWRDNGGACKSWAAAACLFALLQPSEASAERGFAMLRQLDTTNSLIDVLSVQLRLRYARKLPV